MMQQNLVISELRRKMYEPNYDAEDLKKKRELDAINKDLELVKLERLRQERIKELEEYEEKKDLQYKEELQQFNEIQRKLMNIAEKISKQPVGPNIIQLPQPAPPAYHPPPPHYYQQPPYQGYPPPHDYYSPRSTDRYPPQDMSSQPSTNRYPPEDYQSHGSTSRNPPPNELTSDRSGHPSSHRPGVGPLVPPSAFDSHRSGTSKLVSNKIQSSTNRSKLSGDPKSKSKRGAEEEEGEEEEEEEEEPKKTAKSKTVSKKDSGKGSKKVESSRDKKAPSNKTVSKGKSGNGKIEEVDDDEEEDPDDVATKKTSKKIASGKKEPSEKPTSKVKTITTKDVSGKANTKSPRIDFSEIRPEPFDPSEEDILVYINRATHMPSNINLSKIFLYCYDPETNEALFEQSSICTLDSDIYNPQFKLNFRIGTNKLKSNINLHFYILFTTIEEVANQTSRAKKTVSAILGVSYFPFYIQGSDHKPAPLDLEVV